MGIVAEKGIPVLVTNIETDSRFLRKNRFSYRSKSFMSAPIKMGPEIFGVINVADKNSSDGDIFSEIDLKVLVERMVARHNSDPSKQEVLVKKLPTIVGDPIRFAQLFDNLIRNVVKHSAATKVEIYSQEDKKGYRIFIRDNGKGISLENRQKIIKTLTTKEYSSFGFLIISKIVQAYCGDIVIESAEGKGTTVIISFPKECTK